MRLRSGPHRRLLESVIQVCSKGERGTIRDLREEAVITLPHTCFSCATGHQRSIETVGKTTVSNELSFGLEQRTYVEGDSEQDIESGEERAGWTYAEMAEERRTEESAKDLLMS